MLSYLAISALAGLTVAQSSSMMSMQPLVTGTAMAGQTFKVNVGSPEGGLVFQPNVVNAPAGSMIEFDFYPRNHSVVQGSFDNPCFPMDNMMGIYSGFIPSMSGMAPQVFTITVQDMNPIWLYCSQEEHCQNGMAMVINPPTNNMTQTLPNYLAAAASASGAGSLPSVMGGTISTQMPMMTPTPIPTPGSGGMGGMGSSGSMGMGGTSMMGGSSMMGGMGSSASGGSSGSQATAAAAVIGENVAWGVAGAVGVVGAYLL